MKRSLVFLVVVLVFGGTLAPVSVAGGWAIVELAKPLPAVISGEEVTIAFRVLGHGRPDAQQEGLKPVVTLLHRESRERTVVTASAARADPALYEASFTLREAGSYKWNIAPEPYPATAMPTLTVYASAAEAKAAQSAETARTDGPVTEVRIVDSGYAPARLVVAPGTTVEWRNTSAIPHQVVWSGIELDDSAILQTGETVRITFDDEGTFAYYCGPHPFMTGEIVVTEDAEPTPAA